ncbi:MAG: outer membrane beta-barrel protein [Saprospiraceae bacterium]|nr:outer membrane beta-barrel protein [Saprospiraceae bacterium]
MSVGIGGGSILKQSLEGAASYDLKTGYFIGFEYSRDLTKKLSFQTGLNYYSNKVIVTLSYNPDKPNVTREENLELFYLPVSLRYDLSNYFFINAGVLGGIDMSLNRVMTDQSGMGVVIGIGTEISLSDKYSIQVSPYLNLHGLLLVNRDNYPERVLDAGIKLIIILH